MKKRLLAILFALTLAASMLPAGLAVSAANENLIVDGGFEDTYEITPSSTPWKGFYDDGMGSRMTYEEADITPAPGGGDSCFAVYFLEGDAGKYNQALQQSFDVVPGKTYTVSFLINKVGTGQAINAYVGVGNSLSAVAEPVYVMYNLNKAATSGGWMRATKNFTVPASEDETVKATFWFRVNDNNAEGIQAYIDNVSVVEAETQEKVLYTVDGFENMNKLSANSTFSSLAFPVGDNETDYIIYGDVGGRYASYKYLTDTYSIPLVTYPDGNTVLQFKSGSKESYLKVYVQRAIDFTGIEIGTPIRISYKARLVNVPAVADENETFRFYSRGTTVDGLVDQTAYTVTADDAANSRFMAGETAATEGTEVYLVHSSDDTPYMLPMEFAREEVVADDNENAWKQYDVVIPYSGKLKAIGLYSLGYKTIAGYGLSAGYDWELDDLVVTVAEDEILAGNGKADSVERNTIGKAVTQAVANADGSGTVYTVTGVSKAHDAFMTLGYCVTPLDADKKVKGYTAASETTGGATILTEETAEGASVITAVYKVDGDMRTLLGVGIEAAEAGLTAAPEVSLAALENAGTYEVKTYVWNMTTMEATGESTIIEVPAE